MGEENGSLTTDIEIKSEPVNEEDFTATPFEIMPNEINDKNKTDILVWNTSVVKQENEDASAPSAAENDDIKRSGKEEKDNLKTKKDLEKPPAYKEFLCFNCLKSFGYQELRLHMVQVHGHKVSKAYNPERRVPYRSGC